MKRVRLAAMAFALAASVTTLCAQDGARAVTGVVELFTSQGCNSCPPADELLMEVAKRGDVVALGYHVDYWDYRGWRDTMATPENTARQRDYQRSFGGRSVYTPQAVINGRIHLNGAKRSKVMTALDASRSAGLPVDLTVERRGDSVVIKAGSSTGTERSAHLVLVFYDDAKSVQIDAGENNGHKILYVNPVTSLQAAGMWHGRSEAFELPASEIERKGKGGCAVLLQAVTADGSPAAILGAAIIENPATN